MHGLLSEQAGLAFLLRVSREGQAKVLIGLEHRLLCWLVMDSRLRDEVMKIAISSIHGQAASVSVTV